MTSMELTPQAVAGAQFSSVRKGYDPDEVRAFLAKVARGLDGIQTAAGAADARAKSAEAEIIRLREEALAAPAPAPAPPPLTATPTPTDDTEQMSRVLVLAQRTADAAVGEAQQEARAIVTGRPKRRPGPPSPTPSHAPPRCWPRRAPRRARPATSSGREWRWRSPPSSAGRPNWPPTSSAWGPRWRPGASG